MGHPWLWVLLILFWHVGHGGADDGDDFANNIFTDLTPLLSLFGEKVTMQFMSQAVGFADFLLLAMAPLGIVTIIVSAIRVGGPTWLKAIIGRAREDLSVAELELMSSTSDEVCELWNGHNIIRCPSSAEIRQFICFMPKRAQNNWAQMAQAPNFKYLDEVLDVSNGNNLITKIPTSGPRYAYDRLKSCFRRKPGSGPDEETMVNANVQGETATPTNDTDGAQPNPEQAAATTNGELQKMTIITDRNTDGSVPNLSLNCHDTVGRGELYSAAVFGILLQAGVLIFIGFITYHQPLTSRFKKEGKPVDGYAFPCAAIGTVLLAVGMFLCATVVENSTDEISLTAAVQGAELWIVWLQKDYVTSDQVFEPFAIYPTKCRPFITTSRRADRSSRQQGSDRSCINGVSPKLTLEILTILGTSIALVGFVVQFVGLRGLNWVASVTQLGAVVAMTLIRAVVRRGLAQPVRARALMPNAELDSFASTFIDPKAAPWRDSGDTVVKAKLIKTSPH